MPVIDKPLAVISLEFVVPLNSIFPVPASILVMFAISTLLLKITFFSVPVVVSILPVKIILSFSSEPEVSSIFPLVVSESIVRLLLSRNERSDVFSIVTIPTKSLFELISVTDFPLALNWV